MEFNNMIEKVMSDFNETIDSMPIEKDIMLVDDLTDKKSKFVDTAMEEMANADKEEVLAFLEDEVEPIDTHFSNAEATPELPLDEFGEASEFTNVFEQLEVEAAKQLAKQKLIRKTNKEKRNDELHTADSKGKEKSLVQREPAKETIKPTKSNRGRKPKQKKQPELDNPSEEEEEYEIESIISHRLYRNHVVRYEIQWKGYSTEENTVESAKTIHSDVSDLCAAYWDSLPDIPRPLNAPPSKKKVAAPAKKDIIPPIVKKEAATPTIKKDALASKKEVVAAPSKKRGKKEEGELSQHKKLKYAMEHVPQYMLDKGFHYPKSWPNTKTKWNLDMQKFCAIQLSPSDKTVKMAYIEWNNGERTIHTLKECHRKCPEKLIEFYEERLRFV